MVFGRSVGGGTIRLIANMLVLSSLDSTVVSVIMARNAAAADDTERSFCFVCLERALRLLVGADYDLRYTLAQVKLDYTYVCARLDRAVIVRNVDVG